MIHAAGPYLLASVLVGLGLYGILARRNAVLVLVGAELLIAGGSLLLVGAGARGGAAARAGQGRTRIVLTNPAAPGGFALAVVVAAYRRRGHIDLAEDAA